MLKLVTFLSLISAVFAPTLNADESRHGTRTLEIRAEYSGWFNLLDAADVDGDQQGGSHASTAGTGSLGRFTSGGSSDLMPWDETSFCAIDASGNASGIELYYNSFSAVQRLASGDLLYARLASSPPSSLCFNFVDNTFTFEIYMDYFGGTGRFADANGQIRLMGGGLDFLDGSGSLYGEIDGEVHDVKLRRRLSRYKDE